jgi:hypothetical protein
MFPSLLQFLLIFRRAATGELQEESGLVALARLSEIDVSTEGVMGARDFFEAKVGVGWRKRRECVCVCMCEKRVGCVNIIESMPMMNQGDWTRGGCVTCVKFPRCIVVNT